MRKQNEYGFYKENCFANQYNKGQKFDYFKIHNGDVYDVENENGKYTATCSIFVKSSDEHYYEIATHEELSEFNCELSYRIERKWENIIVAILGEFKTSKDAMIYINSLLSNRNK